MKNESGLTVYSLALWSILASVAFMILSWSVPYNSARIRIPYESKVIGKFILPQGWSFFTRDPQEDQLLLYKKGEGGYSIENIRNTSYRNGFGTKKLFIVQSIELGTLAQKIGPKDWVKCSGNKEACFSRLDSLPIVAIKNDMINKVICGEYFMVRTPPVPWAWAQQEKEISMDSEIVKVEVQCGT